MASKRDEFLIRTEKLFLQDRRDRKKLEKLMRDGWEIVSQVETNPGLLLRTSTVTTLRKPNPKYVAR